MQPWFDAEAFQKSQDEAFLWAFFILPSAPFDLREAYKLALAEEEENLMALQARHPGYHGSFNPIEWTEAEENILRFFSGKTAAAKRAIMDFYQTIPKES